jgi:hypothetical protein
MDDQFREEFHRLKMEHLNMRDGSNNYSCFNIEGVKDCDFTYNSRFCFSCSNCDSCFDCVSCVNCKNCAYCVGLIDAEYQILNIQYTKDDFFKKLEEVGIDPNVNAL